MKNAISYIRSLGFEIIVGDPAVASRPLRGETVKELERSNNFYESRVYVRDGRVFVEGPLEDVALVASELMDLDTHDPHSVESLLSSCPLRRGEISDELKLPYDSVDKELSRLEREGMVYLIGDFYFHQRFCERETAERIPMVMVEKYRLARSVARELDGTRIGERFLDKAMFYKGILMRSVWRGQYEIHN